MLWQSCRDFYIADQLLDWYHEHMAEDIALGAEAARFEDIVIPAGTWYTDLLCSLWS